MTDVTDDEAYFLWLSRAAGLNSRKALAVMRALPDIGEAFGAPRGIFKNIEGLTDQNIHNIISSRDMENISNYKRELEAEGITFVTINDPSYPSLLKEIYDPPACFYMLGDMPGDALPTVSVIGSRRCSEYGLTVSRKLSRDLARYGVVTVSGMAKGIDSSAHRGALDSGGKTVAVLGCGVDICYPSENKILRGQIIKNGCVISEYPPGTKPIPYNFPMRNRIISGLSLATVVVEAAEKSGTLITAGQALEQGREVFAVPGNITSKLSRGTNGLLKQGAALIESAEDILNLLGVEGNVIDDAKKISGGGYAELKPEEKVVYDLIGQEPCGAAEIIYKTNSQTQTVQYILTMLEIYGLVRKLPGQRYIRS